MATAFQANAFQSNAFQIDEGLLSRVNTYRATSSTYKYIVSARANDAPYVTKLDRKQEQAEQAPENTLANQPEIDEISGYLAKYTVDAKKTQKHLDAIKVNDALLVKIRLEKSLLLEKLAFIEEMRLKQEQDMQELEEIALLLFDFV